MKCNGENMRGFVAVNGGVSCVICISP